MNTGGYVYPTPMVLAPNGELVPVTAYGDFGGLTLRDKLAAEYQVFRDDSGSLFGKSDEAIAIITGIPYPKKDFAESNHSYWAKCAEWELKTEAVIRYKYADEMLRALEVKP